jgi:glycogen debranching enzyme
MGHCLWASLNPEFDDSLESIIAAEHIPTVVERLFRPDMFERGVGLRTLSTESREFMPNSYHNGSFWPHDQSIVAEGLDYFGYHEKAALINEALLNAFSHFNSAIELYIYEHGEMKPYSSTQMSCMEQGWSAAAMLLTALRSKVMPIIEA